MTRKTTHLIAAGLALVLSTAAGLASAATSTFTATYSGANGSATCGTSYNISGVEPSDSAKHPVFLYMTGTTETYNNGHAMAAVNAMAAKGFVAAAVQYNSGSFGSCTVIGQKAACIFKPGSTSSAVSKLCARARADCSKGIVVSGFSQGSVIATLAKNTDDRVRAAYGMGTYNNYYSLNDVSSCMTAGTFALPTSNLRIANGESDYYANTNAATVRSRSEIVTGKSCGSSAYECLNSDGSGWMMIKGSQVSDGSADHCYQRLLGDCIGSANSIDSVWKTGSGKWALTANLNWLAQFATP
jgi:hypothetical protein